MKYKIYYSFDGIGNVVVEANNKEEAEEKFSNGEWDTKVEDESGENYEIDLVEKA